MAKTTKTQDQKHRTLALYLLTFTLLTGLLAVWLEPLSRTMAQWSQLLHLILGVVVAVPLTLYLAAHFVRTLGARKPLLLATGLVTVAPLAWLTFTGIWVLVFGQTEANTWLILSHRIAAWVLIVAIVAHIALYIPTARKKQEPLSPRLLLQSTVITALTLALLGTAQMALNLSTNSASYLEDVSEDYRLVYGDNPFAPSQNRTPEQKFVSVPAIANSAECGTCHTEIYQQWTSSIHRHAAADPTYVANLNLLESSKGIEATRYCEGCHSPVAIMSGTLTEGGMHGGNPESPAHYEGVGCTTCHRITGVEHTRGTASYYFEPAQAYFLADNSNDISRLLNNLVLRTDPVAHKTEMTTATLYTAELCASCHQQFMDESMNDWGFVSMQDVYSDWIESPYSGQSEHQFAEHNQANCQSCHMPLVKADDPSANADGLVHSHRFPGANTAIPHLRGDQEQVQVIQDFLRANRVRLKIDPLSRSDQPENQTALRTNLLPTHSEKRPYFLYLNETAQVRISVFNRGVGHSFPAGTTDLNEVWIHLAVRDAENRVVYESGFIRDDGFVDPGAYFYKTILVDRRGNEVWRHHLINMVGDAYSNLIEAGETDIKDYQFKVPSWAKGPLVVDARVKYRKFNQRYKNWSLPNTPDLPITEIARDQLEIPLEIRAPLASSK